MSARALPLLLLAVACSSRPDHDPDAERFSSRGRITEVRSDALVIFHERIPTMRTVTGKLEPMDPMAMVFAATSSTPLSDLTAGDPIRFTFTVDYKKPPPLRLVAIEKLPADTKLDLPAAPPAE
ncbi:MAG: copper-binding protein [Deltaproteobacteria bacterium]|nr:copper-binding protein [Deltaproteobacteria bacterium]MCW5802821.1 copper-binding protein [Deltaproteobacteria bacterium]